MSDEKFNDERFPAMPKRRFDFSHSEYTKLVEICPFSEEELQILDMRRRGKSDIEICFKLNLSERTLTRRIESIAEKIQKEI